MKTINYLIVSGAIILLSAFTINESVNWNISDNHSIKFSGTEVEGIFKDLKGSVQFDETNLDASKISFAVSVNSINTGNGTKTNMQLVISGLMLSNFQTLDLTQNRLQKQLLDIQQQET